jgi:hypothetical protein
MKKKLNLVFYGNKYQSAKKGRNVKETAERKKDRGEKIPRGIRTGLFRY